MNAQMESLDQEITTIIIDAQSWSPMQDVLTKLHGGNRVTQTHSAIGAHQQEGKIYFVELLGRKVELGGSSNSATNWSIVYGQKAFELINHYRGEQDLVPLEWSDNLHSIAYSWSVEQAQVGKISHDKFDENSAQAKQQLAGMVGFAENVAMNMVQPTSAAMDKVVEQWIDSEGHRTNIVGDFNYSAIAVSVKSATNELYFTQLFANAN